MVNFQLERIFEDGWARLLGALIGLARATDGNEHLISPSSTSVMIESLAAVHAGDSSKLGRLSEQVVQEKRSMVPACFSCASPCGKNSDYPIENLLNAGDDIRSLKYRIVTGICTSAAYICHTVETDHRELDMDAFFYKALIVLGMDDYTAEDLLPIVPELEAVEAKCMEIAGCIEP